MKFLGLEIGSWSSWFGSLLTAVGIYLGLRKNKINLKGTLDIIDHGIRVRIANKSNFIVNIKGVNLVFKTIIRNKEIDFINISDDKITGDIETNKKPLMTNFKYKKGTYGLEKYKTVRVYIQVYLIDGTEIFLKTGLIRKGTKLKVNDFIDINNV